MVLPPRASEIARATILSELAPVFTVLMPGNLFSNTGKIFAAVTGVKVP